MLRIVEVVAPETKPPAVASYSTSVPLLPHHPATVAATTSSATTTTGTAAVPKPVAAAAKATKA
jgi:hypothetical protein